MSTLEVTRRRISEIGPHPNADRLEIAKVEGLNWQFCTQKGNLSPGSEVVHFPLDSVLPDPLAEALGVKPFLGGPDRNYIRSAIIRGQRSQGLIVPVPAILAFLGVETLPSGLTEALGVTRYEPPGITISGAVLGRLPAGVHKYDIENSENFPSVLGRLSAVPVCITEKLEGTNFSITIEPDGRESVNQRDNAIIPKMDATGDENTYWHVAKDRGYLAATKKAWSQAFPAQQLTVYGEMVGPGIQGNIYGLSAIEVAFFDVLVDGEFVGADTWIDLCSVFGLPTVPILAKDIMLGEWLAGRAIHDASDGQSVFGSKPAREGIVIKPMRDEMFEFPSLVEGEPTHVKRLILKQRSPKYLSKG